MGVVGAGGLGYHHVRILREMPSVTLAGFYEQDEARRALVARELEAPAFDTLDALLDATDALNVVVPTPAHFDVARAALARGKHLLIEKPITTTLEQADELIAMADRAGVVVQTGHVERFNRAIRAALPYVERPRFIESDRLAPFSPRGSDVAVVLDLMIHDIDLVRTLVGAPVDDVRAVGVPVLTPTVDIANARLGFTSGAVANITASRVSRERLRKIRIFQQSGYLSLDLAAGTGEFFRLRGGVDVASIAKAPPPLDLAMFVERVPLEAPEGEPLRLEFDSFVAAVRGEQPVAVSARDGRDALDVALRIVGEIERTLPSLRGAALATS
ncbi:oxidoreductase domain protein [Gemmatirosa kalamazoonensis]|uniref:Oxidoreductase domain protein n=1 Tax=Gemmatirosa kalamazoonensis TaxID=861299 RepID=W0RKC0_9BACT|nr:Gfo/Idh/MocA family oxidoreductase [Gemmatirosa kalamazoonensis]AHG90760.1 oxidoreductase domain protein [Gemmatirosa kalamazoonensis]